MPQKSFVDAAGDIGFINKPPDTDGVLRRVRNFYIDFTGRVHFSLAMEAWRSYLGISRDEIRVSNRRGVFLNKRLVLSAYRGISPLNYLVYPEEFNIVPA